MQIQPSPRRVHRILTTSVAYHIIATQEYAHHSLSIRSPLPHFSLTKVGGDVAIMPAIIISLVAARSAAGRIADPFDDGLMKLHQFPFLEEARHLHRTCMCTCVCVCA